MSFGRDLGQKGFSSGFCGTAYGKEQIDVGVEQRPCTNLEYPENMIAANRVIQSDEVD
jgi:hypothetical protein